MTIYKDAGVDIKRADAFVGSISTTPQIFKTIQWLGNISDEDMAFTFNMGLGFVVIMDRETAKKASGWIEVGVVK
jgi:phosphoribosylaminoimidazole (AIR) synthetase